ncbi:hypothetical protein PRCB_01405 [Pantoea rodasii]|uniref:Uncharacterized protein n=1 Tax=Pantoea rodasii TaxID=1076549 RepID=A0A2M9WIR4_9GAMM|nr:hypothetical protein [Pantoea rodasii]ORM64219.1 hypothetical protein HA45_10305 [Pantoea rodasii]PJZ07348.1 hypothetical protein PRCB_01405 [Pantoea rodasii]
MKDDKSTAIRVIGGQDIVITGNKSYGFDTAVHLEDVTAALVKGNSSYNIEALKVLDDIKNQVEALVDPELSDSKKHEVLSMLEELKDSDKETAYQKIERITNILSNCATISPLIVFSLQSLFGMIFK